MRDTQERDGRGEGREGREEVCEREGEGGGREKKFKGERERKVKRECRQRDEYTCVKQR